MSLWPSVRDVIVGVGGFALYFGGLYVVGFGIIWIAKRWRSPQG